MTALYAGGSVVALQRCEMLLARLVHNARPLRQQRDRFRQDFVEGLRAEAAADNENAQRAATVFESFFG